MSSDDEGQSPLPYLPEIASDEEVSAFLPSVPAAHRTYAMLRKAGMTPQQALLETLAFWRELGRMGNQFPPSKKKPIEEP